MNLKGILAIAEKPGLYKLVSQGKNNIIVEGLEDKKRMPVYGAHQISALEEISIYTYDEDFPLKDVFENIYKLTEKKEAITHKSSKNELIDFFAKVLPNYDEDRVYISDIKKVIQWYNVLFRNGMFEIEEEVPEADQDDTKEAPKEEEK